MLNVDLSTPRGLLRHYLKVRRVFLAPTRHGLGLAAHRGWVRLLTGRMCSHLKCPERACAPELARGSTEAYLQGAGAMGALRLY